MALQFNPPEWLVQQFMNQKTPAEQVGESIQTGLAALVKQQEAARLLKAQKEKQDLERVGTVAKLYEAGGPHLAGQYAPALGVASPAGFQPPTPSTGTVAGSSPVAPMQGPALPGVGLGLRAQQTPRSGMGAPSPIIKAISGTPDMDQLAQMGKYGQRVRDQQKTALEMAKLERDLATDPNAPINVLTEEDAIKRGQMGPRDRIVNTRTNDIRDERVDDRRRNDVLRYAQTIETHPVIKELNKQQIGLDQVNEMVNVIKSGNTVAASAMGTKMARAMGEVGVLTESDISRYVQSGRLDRAAADKLSRWTKGRPSDATIQEIQQISEVLRDSFAGKVQPVYDRYIDRFARAHNVSPEDAAYQLNFPYSKGIQAPVTSSALTPDRQARLAELRAKKAAGTLGR